MNKAIKILTIVFVSIIVLASATPCHAKKHTTRTHVRYMDGLIYCYDVNTRLVYIQTDDGNVWTIKADCTQLGCVRVKFDTRNTKRVTDDRIVKITFIK